MKIYLTNLGKYNEGELVGQWLVLPYSDAELKAVLHNIGIGAQYEEYFITDYDNDMGFDIGEYESLSELNNVALRINNLDPCELITLQAAIEYESADLSSVMDIIDHLDDYTLYEDIHDDKELGYYYIHEIGVYDITCMGNLANYIDYEAYGYDMRLEINGGFTSLGWLEHS